MTDIEIEVKAKYYDKVMKSLKRILEDSCDSPRSFAHAIEQLYIETEGTIMEPQYKFIPFWRNDDERWTSRF